MELNKKSERKFTGKHLFEFTQADFEIAGAKMEDVFSIVEEYYEGLTKYLKKKTFPNFIKLM